MRRQNILMEWYRQTNSDLQQEAMTSDGVVYVNSYIHSDETKIKVYHRSH